MSQIATDPIADMLTRIRNATMVRHTEVTMPYSRTKEAIAVLLQEAGFVGEVSVKEEAFKLLHIVLLVDQPGKSITALERVSKPGRRVYIKSSDIPVIRRGQGLVIMSTSKGMMSGKKAYSQALGGELICKVW